MRSPVETVAAWHEAVNAGDIEGAVACCHPEIEVGGPRGTGHGHDLMRGWLARSGIRLEPQHDLVESEPGVIHVEELACWTAEQTPFPAPTEPTLTWCAFRVEYECLVSVVRYEERPVDSA